MGYFDWDEKFETGVGKMDDQHKGLILLMNQLHQESEENVGRDRLLTTMKELQKRTAQHFQEEERFMKSIEYRELASHRVIHEQLLNTFSDHVTKFEASTMSTLPAPFFTFLKLWLSSHIRGVDTRYAEPARKGAA